MNIKRVLKMKRVRLAINCFLKILFGFVYDKKYLSGKHFEDSYVGWLWAYNNLSCKLFGENRKIPWPISKYSTISSAHNIQFDQSSINCFQQKGCYFQNFSGNITIGKNVWIAPNVGLITANHDINDLSRHKPGEDITIEDNCWVGMNSVILPGVRLGKKTIVGTGSVVTKSFPEGNCVIAGIPAKVIKHL